MEQEQGETSAISFAGSESGSSEEFKCSCMSDKQMTAAKTVSGVGVIRRDQISRHSRPQQHPCCPRLPPDGKALPPDRNYQLLPVHSQWTQRTRQRSLPSQVKHDEGGLLSQQLTVSSKYVFHFRKNWMKDILTKRKNQFVDRKLDSTSHFDKWAKYDGAVPRCYTMPSLSHMTSAESQTSTQARSLTGQLRRDFCSSCKPKKTMTEKTDRDIFFLRRLVRSTSLPPIKPQELPGQFPSEAMETKLCDPPPLPTGEDSNVPGCIPKERGSCVYPPLSPRRGSVDDIDERCCLELPLTKLCPTADPNTQYASDSSTRTNLESEGDVDVLVDCEQGIAATAVNCSVINTLSPPSQSSSVSSGPDCSERVSGSVPGSQSSPSLGHITSAESQVLIRGLNELLLTTSYEHFTPDISTDGEDETYRFHCSRSGLYQCMVTGLLFQMEREGDVVYRTVHWDRKLLSQHRKQPAGPLFEISCEQQSVCQLHLPHCEIRSTGGDQHLSVAHVNQEGVDFIIPHEITETHVIINISSFSGFGNVKNDNSPSVPIRALVLLFYRPPVDPDPSSVLNVLLLPKNVVLRDVQRIRKKTVGDERYIETSPHCKLHPQQDYTLSTCPEDSSVLVEPTTAEFDCEDYDNYFPSFQVNFEQTMKHIQLSLKHTSSSISVWDRRVCLQCSGVQRSCGQSALNQTPSQRLLDIRSSFIQGVSGPVLKSLLDKLFDKTVMVESEQESVDGIPNKSDKARFVIDTVRKKGEAASSEMMEALCEIDPFLSEHLGLI